MDHVEAPELAAEAARLATGKLDSHLLECSALDAAMGEEAVAAAVREASEAGLRAIVVRPSDLDFAARIVSGDTILAAAVSYPAGASTTSVKVYEARDAIRRGAREIHAVANIGKLNSRHFQYVEMELIQLAQTCHELGAKLRAVFRTPLLGEEAKLVASKIAKRSEVDSVLADFGAAAPGDEELLLRKCPPLVAVAVYRATKEEALRAIESGFSFVHGPGAAMLR